MSRKINIALKQGTDDFRWVTLPWTEETGEQPWEIEIARANYGPFKKWGEKEREKNPYFRKIAQASQANLVLSPDSKVSERLLGKILGEMDPADLDQLTEIGKKGMASIRIRNVRGFRDKETGEEYSYDYDLGMHILNLQTPVKEWIDLDLYLEEDGTPKKDKDGVDLVVPKPETITLGDAIFNYLAAQSNKLELYKTQLLEAATKNFEVSSAST